MFVELLYLMFPAIEGDVDAETRDAKGNLVPWFGDRILNREFLLFLMPMVETRALKQAEKALDKAKGAADAALQEYTDYVKLRGKPSDAVLKAQAKQKPAKGEPKNAYQLIQTMRRTSRDLRAAKKDADPIVYLEKVDGAGISSESLTAEQREAWSAVVPAELEAQKIQDMLEEIKDKEAAVAAEASAEAAAAGGQGGEPLLPEGEEGTTTTTKARKKKPTGAAAAAAAEADPPGETAAAGEEAGAETAAAAAAASPKKAKRRRRSGTKGGGKEENAEEEESTSNVPKAGEPKAAEAKASEETTASDDKEKEEKTKPEEKKTIQLHAHEVANAAIAAALEGNTRAKVVLDDILNGMVSVAARLDQKHISKAVINKAYRLIVAWAWGQLRSPKVNVCLNASREGNIDGYVAAKGDSKRAVKQAHLGPLQDVAAESESESDEETVGGGAGAGGVEKVQQSRGPESDMLADLETFKDSFYQSTGVGQIRTHMEENFSPTGVPRPVQFQKAWDLLKSNTTTGLAMESEPSDYLMKAYTAFSAVIPVNTLAYAAKIEKIVYGTVIGPRVPDDGRLTVESLSDSTFSVDSLDGYLEQRGTILLELNALMTGRRRLTRIDLANFAAKVEKTDPSVIKRLVVLDARMSTMASDAHPLLQRDWWVWFWEWIIKAVNGDLDGGAKEGMTVDAAIDSASAYWDLQGEKAAAAARGDGEADAEAAGAGEEEQPQDEGDDEDKAKEDADTAVATQRSGGEEEDQEENVHMEDEETADPGAKGKKKGRGKGRKSKGKGKGKKGKKGKVASADADAVKEGKGKGKGKGKKGKAKGNPDDANWVSLPQLRSLLINSSMSLKGAETLKQPPTVHELDELKSLISKELGKLYAKGETMPECLRTKIASLKKGETIVGLQKVAGQPPRVWYYGNIVTMPSAGALLVATWGPFEFYVCGGAGASSPEHLNYNPARLIPDDPGNLKIYPSGNMGDDFALMKPGTKQSTVTFKYPKRLLRGAAATATGPSEPSEPAAKKARVGFGSGGGNGADGWGGPDGGASAGAEDNVFDLGHVEEVDEGEGAGGVYASEKDEELPAEEKQKEEGDVPEQKKKQKQKQQKDADPNMITDKITVTAHFLDIKGGQNTWDLMGVQRYKMFREKTKIVETAATAKEKKTKQNTAFSKQLGDILPDQDDDVVLFGKQDQFAFCKFMKK